MIIGEKKVFASTLTYELGRQLGIERAAREFARQMASPSRESLPVVRLFARLAQIGKVAVYHGASTTLPKARSRAAHEALKSGADFWVMCDDDVECDSSTLMRLLAIAGPPDGKHAAVLPCLIRGAGAELDTANVQFVGELLDDGGSKRVLRGGTGCMVLSRGALQAVADRFRNELAWLDDDRQQKIALFQLQLSGGEWLGEDFSFCERLRVAGVELRAPTRGTSSHAGAVLQLESLR